MMDWMDYRRADHMRHIKAWARKKKSGLDLCLGEGGGIIALVNNRGGVGKTTTAVNLAAGIAAEGKRVLLIDLDAQGAASLSLGLTMVDLTPGVAEVILEGHPYKNAIHPSSVKGLDILPGSMALAFADPALSVVKFLVLRYALTQNAFICGYDFIILDCPPSLGLMTVNALIAADYFIIPLTPDYLSHEGLVNFLEAVKTIGFRFGGKVAAPLGILLTLADYRLNVTEEIVRMIRRHYGDLVFNAEIRDNIRLKEAPFFGKSIFDYDNGSSGAEAYRELTREVLQRIGARHNSKGRMWGGSGHLPDENIEALNIGTSEKKEDEAQKEAAGSSALAEQVAPETSKADIEKELAEISQEDLDAMLDDVLGTPGKDESANTKIWTDQLKKGARVRMRNGYEAIVVKECDGNTLIAKVFGAFTETGSVYAHNIVATEVDGEWIEVEMTEEQARFYRGVKPFFDGNINLDTIKCK